MEVGDSELAAGGVEVKDEFRMDVFVVVMSLEVKAIAAVGWEIR